jgi:membrane protein
VATILWLCASLAFKFYVGTFTDYEGSYGAVGGIIILLLWLYLSGLGILIGAELNAELERAMPYGAEALTDKESGRRVIGPRAARLFERLRSGPPPVVPSPPSAPGPNRWATLAGLAFTTAVLTLRGPRRVMRGGA